MTLGYGDADGERCVHVVRGGESHCENCGERVAPDARRRAEFADARAQLWARVYAIEIERVYEEAKRDGVRGHIFDGAAPRARATADAAVRDFDEHYLGGKR